MKWPVIFICLVAFCSTAVSTPFPVGLEINTQSPGYDIPQDFAGLSFETGSELPNKNRVHGYLFCATNTALITLFRNAGIHNLRLGGGTVDGTKAALPSYEAIDNIFAFAKAVGNLKVIYSLRLLNGDSATDAAIAQYIWQRYRPLVASFAVGNEPDWKSYHYPPFGRGTDRAITNYSTYLAVWKQFAAAVTNAAPGATFVGPDTGDYEGLTDFEGKSWTELFANDEKLSGIISAVTQHFYVGGNPGSTTGTEAIHNMLSPDWVLTNYPRLYGHYINPAVENGLPYRLTESNDYLFGITNASDSFASALWALDYMHWWAAHGCAGVNFHNKSWLRTDTIYLDPDGNYRVHPKAYGIKAFELGSQGRVMPLTMHNVHGLNLTAYAVGNAHHLNVTIINKEHDSGARDAVVNIALNGFAVANVSTMILSSTNHEAAATNGITLGSASINRNAPWNGQWTSLRATNTQCTVTVPAASAAIVRLESAIAPR